MNTQILFYENNIKHFEEIFNDPTISDYNKIK